MSKSGSRIVAIVLLVAFAIWLLITFIPKGNKSDHREKKATAGQAYEPKFKKEGELLIMSPEGDTIRNIDIEIAETREEISYGMMYRRSMDPNTGMLFLMDEERPQSFYMKNTYVSLDIIFINDDMEIVSIQKNAEPLNERSLPSEGPASYVLEVVGGFSDEHGVGKGSKISFQRN